MEHGISEVGKALQRLLSIISGPSEEADPAAYQQLMITMIILFCASGTGIYGAVISGISSDHSILISKAILDFFHSYDICLFCREDSFFDSHTSAAGAAVYVLCRKIYLPFYYRIYDQRFQSRRRDPYDSYCFSHAEDKNASYCFNAAINAAGFSSKLSLGILYGLSF